MFRRFPLALIAAVALVANLGAQATTPPAAPQATPAPPARAVPTQNVRVDLVITDTFGTSPAKKTVTMLLLDGRRGSIRSSQSLPVVDMSGKVSYTSIGIDLDATPAIRSDGRVELALNASYTPNRTDIAPGGNAAQFPASINESMTTLLLDGKPTLLSQSADPQSDRKVTLEVTATVVR
jgi:hypothetical protein